MVLRQYLPTPPRQAYNDSCEFPWEGHRYGDWEDEGCNLCSAPASRTLGMLLHFSGSQIYRLKAGSNMLMTHESTFQPRSLPWGPYPHVQLLLDAMEVFYGHLKFILSKTKLISTPASNKTKYYSSCSFPRLVNRCPFRLRHKLKAWAVSWLHFLPSCIFSSSPYPGNAILCHSILAATALLISFCLGLSSPATCPRVLYQNLTEPL